MPRRRKADTGQSPDEIARYSLVAGYFQHFKGGGSLLDVGCGVGTLAKRLGPHAYSRYVGFDLPGEPIRVASRNADKKTVLRCEDANTYTPPETYDAIVFNESLYYLRNPLKVVQRYQRCLERDGIVIVSMVTFPGVDRYWRGLEAAYRVLDETTATRKSGISWTCKVLSGKARGLSIRRASR